MIILRNEAKIICDWPERSFGMSVSETEQL